MSCLDHTGAAVLFEIIYTICSPLFIKNLLINSRILSVRHDFQTVT